MSSPARVAPLTLPCHLRPAQECLKGRHKTGFRGGRGGREAGGQQTPSLERRFRDLFDPTITLRTLINEGVLFIGLAFWCVVYMIVHACMDVCVPVRVVCVPVRVVCRGHND